MIESRLDNDYYNFLMSQLIWRHWPDCGVVYAFKNRSLGTRLGDVFGTQGTLNRLREEIDYVRSQKVNDADLVFLREQKVFSEEYLTWLQTKCQLPEVDVWRDSEGWLYIEYGGRWCEAVFWETHLLALVNELYFHADTETIARGRERLLRKIEVLRQNTNVRFAEFGTRRRFSANWHAHVLRALLNEIPDQLIGTSNPHFAANFHIPVVGTMAHQLFMVLAARTVGNEDNNPLVRAEHSVINIWADLYPPELWAALTDTFGTPHFLANATQAMYYRAFRQDSGDPILIGEQYLAYWQGLGIDPLDRSIIFSDGLDLNKMLALALHFSGRTNYSFGWGTGLTNDLGPQPLQTVIKPKSVDGYPTVKLSDDLAKATGSRDQVAKYKELAHYGRWP